MRKPGRNVAASIHARLLARAREHREDFNLSLQRYAAERFLFRLGESAQRDGFILKGAMLYALWGGSIYRPTRDLDFTAYGSSDIVALLARFREICRHTVPDDGLIFDGSSLDAERIRGDAEYDGVRVRFRARLGNARIPMQVDVGFGNAIEPPANDVEYPTLLPLPPPRIRAYLREAVVAEKLHAMVLLGERNSRMKDFYDLYVLARQFAFDGPRLANAIGATFKRRRTVIEPEHPASLTPRFFADPARSAQWRAYLQRNGLPGAPADFGAVGDLIRAFLGAPWGALADGKNFELTWRDGGWWKAKPVAAPLRAAIPPTADKDVPAFNSGDMGGASVGAAIPGTGR